MPHDPVGALAEFLDQIPQSFNWFTILFGVGRLYVQAAGLLPDIKELLQYVCAYSLWWLCFPGIVGFSNQQARQLNGGNTLVLAEQSGADELGKTCFHKLQIGIRNQVDLVGDAYVSQVVDGLENTKLY